MDSIPEIAEKISRQIEEHGVSVDRGKVMTKLELLVSEFSIPVEEAERTVKNELMREYKINTQKSPASGTTEKRDLGDVKPGDWVTVEGKVVSLQVSRTPTIAQRGIIDDGTGAMEFVIWAKADVETLEERRWYRFESAVVDEYKGAPSLKIHSGTTVMPLAEDRPIMPVPTPVAELKPGIASVRVTLVQEWEVLHENMLQSGIVGDETGTLKFVIWKGGADKLQMDMIDTIFYARVDEYNGRLSLNLTDAMCIADPGTLEVATGNETLKGALVHLGGGTGLIRRCPVEGCKRVLSRQNYCPVHEYQESFRYDLRITGVVDDGKKAHNIIVGCEVTEKMSGISLDKAKEIAENNPLGFDDVAIRIRNNVLGRYISCKGTDLDGTLLVKGCEPVKMDREAHAELINRAAPQQEGGDEE